MEEVEIPPGLIRTWKAFVIALATGVVGSVVTGYLGHSIARVVEKEVRVEVPPAGQCLDEMMRIEDESDKKHISCSHPLQHGEFKTVHFESWSGNVPFLVCTCPHAQLDLDAGAK